MGDQWVLCRQCQETWFPPSSGEVCSDECAAAREVRLALAPRVKMAFPMDTAMQAVLIEGVLYEPGYTYGVPPHRVPLCREHGGRVVDG